MHINPTVDLSPSLRELQNLNRRLAPRIPYKVKALFKPEWRVNQPCLIGDISENGVFLIARERLFVRSEVLLYLPVVIKEHENICMLPGRVVRVETKAGIPAFGYGIAFDPLPNGTLRTLRKFIGARIPQPAE